MQWMGMRATMKGCENVRGDIQLILAIGRKERLFRAKIKHGEGWVRRRGEAKIGTLRLGRHLVFFTDEGHLFTLYPSVVTGCVIFEPEDEVKVLGGMLHIEKIFLKVFEANWREVATCKNILEADIEDGGDTTRTDFANSRGRITEAVLRQSGLDGPYGSKQLDADRQGEEVSEGES